MKMSESVDLIRGEGVPVPGFGSGTLSFIWAPKALRLAGLPDDRPAPRRGAGQGRGGRVRTGWRSF